MLNNILVRAGILVSAHGPAARAVAQCLAAAGLAGAVLSGCGQQGSLYLPTDPAAAQRATLLESLRPAKPPASSPAGVAPASTP